MKACLDVHYRPDGAMAACCLFEDWSSETARERYVRWISPVAPYRPGHFYLRELPCLLEVLDRVGSHPDLLVVDGYVWLGDETRPGLGAHFHRVLRARIPVIGVAKNSLRGAGPARAVLRGRSARPLFVSAVGIDLDAAADRIRFMHGPHRIPSLLREVDRLCRRGAQDRLRPPETP